MGEIKDDGERDGAKRRRREGEVGISFGLLGAATVPARERAEGKSNRMRVA
jgi:hypothetical protein